MSKKSKKKEANKLAESISRESREVFNLVNLFSENITVWDAGSASEKGNALHDAFVTHAEKLGKSRSVKPPTNEEINDHTAIIRQRAWERRPGYVLINFFDEESLHDSSDDRYEMIDAALYLWPKYMNNCEYLYIPAGCVPWLHIYIGMNDEGYVRAFLVTESKSNEEFTYCELDGMALLATAKAFGTKDVVGGVYGLVTTFLSTGNDMFSAVVRGSCLEEIKRFFMSGKKKARDEKETQPNGKVVQPDRSEEIQPDMKEETRPKKKEVQPSRKDARPNRMETQPVTESEKKSEKESVTEAQGVEQVFEVQEEKPVTEAQDGELTTKS